ELEWLGKPGDPDYDKLANWIAAQPLNQKAGVDKAFLDDIFGKLTKQADRQEAFEKLRAIPVVPTFMKSVDGSTNHVVNRGMFSFFPSPTNATGRGINDWY